MPDPTPTPEPQTSNSPPDKFTIQVGNESKVLTKDEAVKMLAEAAATKSELAGLKSKVSQGDSTLEQVRKVFNTNDPEAFRAVAKSIGWTGERIDAVLNARAMREQAMRRAAERDDDDDDDEEPAPRRTTHTAPQTAAVDNAEYEALKQGFKKMAGVLETMAIRDIENNLWPALEGDKILGQHVKDRGKRAYQLHRVAVDEAKKLFRQSGGAAPEVFEGAVAKARASLEDWGILDDSKESRATSVGQTPSFGLGSTFQPLDKLPNETKMTGTDYTREIGTLLADAMASGDGS